ncbi:hypothetical protein Pcinc_031460 [Petrolisthes cinctipes]|uniref:RNA polymerase II-associated protein 3 n=1 Tax=Petrolisthes cinctipes TaxID=88211 RepID=A0AAE1K4H8_PETCI|nr:hypothetical protein Pcinc_031460 [Petrolisthes cinctipes]
MAKNSHYESIILQNNIKNKSAEVQDFIRDLKNWEKDIKKEDEKLSSQNKDDTTTTKKAETAVPIRCKKKLETSSSQDSSKSSSVDIKCQKSESASEKRNRISGYDYAAWDKFDVDNALVSDEEEEDLENEEASGSEEKKKSGGGNRGPKLSKKERAVAMKDEGNKLYSNGRLDDAIAKYTQGMALDPTNALLPANRAMAYIKIRKFKAAEADCNKCLKLDGKYVKGYLRRATARMNLDKNDLALKDYQKVLELEPWNKEAKKELEKHKYILDKETSTVKETPQSNNKSTAETNNEDIRKNSKPGPKTNVESERSVEERGTTLHKTEKASQGGGKQISRNEKRGKKVKILEVNSQEDSKQQVPTDPNTVLPIDKPPHLRSTKPLKRIPVVDVPTRDGIRKESQTSLQVKTSKTTSPTKVINEPKKPLEKPVSPSLKDEVKVSASTQVPRTSHQFTQEWGRVSSHQNQAVEYLKIIPPAFFSGLDLDTDIMMELVTSLKNETIPTDQAAQCLLALSKSTGFSVNIMFLDDSQKKEFHEVISKCEEGLDDKNSLESLKSLI